MTITTSAPRQKAGLLMARTTVRRVRGVRWIGLAALLAVAAACGGTPAPPPVVRVDRGPVSASVTASGNLVAITEQNLGFPKAGKLTEVLVGVGAHVEPGQILARLDDFEMRKTLDQKLATVRQEQAKLDKLRNGTTINGAEKSLDQSNEILDATEDQSKAQNEANKAATQRARKQLDFDRYALGQAEQALSDDEKTCGSGDDGDDDPPSKKKTSSTTMSGQQTPAPTTDPAQAACERLPSDRSAVLEAKRTVLASETALVTAQHKEDLDEASGRLNVENARKGVVTDSNTRDQANSDVPADVAAQIPVVAAAQAAADIAQRDVDNMVLKAPVRGVVSAINGVVGEFVGQASGLTPLAPGSTAAVPDVGNVSSSSTNGGTSGSGSTGGGGSSGAFMKLDNVDSFQLVVPFEESDAAKVQPGMAVKVGVDAVPGLSKPGTVLAMSPSGQESSGVIRYNATIVLTEGDPQLRDGQTAEASVVTKQLDNVLRVPSSVVRTEAGGRTLVDVRKPDGTVAPQSFTPGFVGDDHTEVLSGLTEGTEVVQPQAKVPSTSGGGGGGG
jgi:HlyD family secretion protein